MKSKHYCIVGKSTLACALNQKLYQKGKLCYILDGDNVRHGLNRDLSFKAEDRAENIRRVGELFNKRTNNSLCIETTNNESISPLIDLFRRGC